MFLLLVSCFSVILLSKSLSSSKKHHHDRHPRMQGEWWRSFPPWKKSFQKGVLRLLTPLNKMMKMKLGCYYNNKKEGNCDNTASSLSLLDLPELTLECILDRLSPAGLCAMAGVCSSLRERCTSDHLWEKHMTQKWGKLMGNAAFREWQWHIASSTTTTTTNRLHPPTNHNTLFARFSSCFNPKSHSTGNLHRRRSHLPVHSIMSWYLSLETAKFCFPAQIYNRENGHAGFMLSCYDAKLTYDSKTDTFEARYSSRGRGTTEENIPWDRLRAPPVDTCSYDLHISDSLLELKPGDHIEIQWRRNKEFPYGWWYCVVGHMESCTGNENHCRCRYTDTVMLEFKQYPSSSRWRKIGINRKDHREVGNEGDGFYGGIRKLYKEEEISKWKRLWPNRVLE